MAAVIRSLGVVNPVLATPPGGGVLVTRPSSGTVYQGAGAGTATITASQAPTYRAVQERAIAVRAEIAALMGSGAPSPAVAGCDGNEVRMYEGTCTPDLVRQKIFLVEKYDEARAALRRLAVLPRAQDAETRTAYVHAVGAWTLVAYEAAALRRVWKKPFEGAQAPAPMYVQGAAGTPASAPRLGWMATVWATLPADAVAESGTWWPALLLGNQTTLVTVYARGICEERMGGAGGVRRTICVAPRQVPSGRMMVEHAQKWAQYLSIRDIWMLLQENIIAYGDYLKPYAERGVANLTPDQIVAMQNEMARKPLSIMSAGGQVISNFGVVGAVLGAIFQVISAVLPMAVGTYSCPIPIFTRSLVDANCSTTTAGGAQQAAERATTLTTASRSAYIAEQLDKLARETTPVSEPGAASVEKALWQKPVVWAAAGAVALGLVVLFRR